MGPAAEGPRGLRRLKAWRNRNVQLSLVFTAGYALANGLWANAVLTGYLDRIPPHKNTFVGLAEGLQGSMQALVALPSGAVADRTSRQRVLRAAAVLGAVGVALMFATLGYGISIDHHPERDTGYNEFVLMCVALSFMGFFDGVSSGPLEAVFHDSVSVRERPMVTTAKFVTRVFFRACGPLISAVLFYIVGDTWDRSDLREVLFIGVGFSLLPMAVCFFFRDSRTLGAESEAVVLLASPDPMQLAPTASATPGGEPTAPLGPSQHQQTARVAPSTSTSSADDDDGDDDDDDDDDVIDNGGVSGSGGNGSSASTAAGSAARTGIPSAIECAEVGLADTGVGLVPDGLETPLLPSDPAAREARRQRRAKVQYWVPRLVLGCDIMFGLASGMTNKFFALFFKYKVLLSPSQVNWVYVVAPLFVISLSLVTARIARYLGRILTPVIFSSTGICMLFTLWILGQFKDDDGVEYLWRETHLVLPIFVMRMACMNCCQPIRKSVLIDFVPKKARARWNSLDSITKMSWSGSAVFGGILCDKYGYGASFLVTACMQTVAISIYACLFFFRHEITGRAAKREKRFGQS